MEFIEFDNANIDLAGKKIIGVDECGVGDYFGYLVACAVFIPLENIDKVLALGVKDSKKLTDKKMMELRPELIKLVNYYQYPLSPRGFNSLTKYNNGNEIKAIGHTKTINIVTQNMARQKLGKTDYIFIDQFSTFDKSKEYFNKVTAPDNFAKLKPFKAPVLLAHKAEDKHLSVAVASILARCCFLDKMAEMNQKYGVTFPLGAGNNVKEFAKDFFAQEGHERLRNEVAKTSFDMEI